MRTLLRTPRFWSAKRPTAVAQMLRPLGAVYGSVAAQRLKRGGYRSKLPVVCIGNFTAGGAGKTPTAIWVAEELKRLGRKPAFLSRGYGGSIAGPHLVDTGRDHACSAGDEPLLLAKVAPTVIARDRAAGARLIETLDADVIVMDDGLQNPSLAKDLTIAVVDAGAGFGNGLVIPAGPLRAPLAKQLPLVQAIVVIGDDANQSVALPGWTGQLCRARLAVFEDVSWLRGKPVAAFAGIGRPEKFFNTLRALGAGLVAARGYPDHHQYTEADARLLAAEATRHSAVLVTTEKDHVRLHGTAALSDLAQSARVLRIGLEMPDQSRLALIDHLRRLSKPQPR